MDQVLKNSDEDVKKMRDNIENMWSVCNTQRLRRTMATEVPGYTLAGDNVGTNITHILEKS